MTKEENNMLSDLYSDKITIADVCKSLNKTRKEVWDLLDEFEYFPTSEDVIIACKIEQESMRRIENRVIARKKYDYENKSSDMLAILYNLLEPLKLKKFSSPA